MAYSFLIIGAGFSGAVLANRLANTSNCRIDIWDEREHIGGNCYTERDKETGVMVHKYGPHIFNTDKKEIWDFVNSFVEFRPYVHRVKAMSNGKIYSLPVNLQTINQLFGKTFNPAEAKEFLETLSDRSVDEPKNFEEQALRLIGKQLYYTFFYGYTKKQWGCEPVELPASILKRLPVRFTYDDNYYNNPFSGIPVNGYTELFEKLIDSPNIIITLNKKFTAKVNVEAYDHIFYTGPIDAYFEFAYGRLGYRTVTFSAERTDGDYQGTSVINYCDESIPFTRIAEHKHFTPWEEHQKTIYFKEYSKETGPGDMPYYPKGLVADKKLLKKYQQEAEQLSNISFLGRLATYRYMDMHHVIEEALNYSKVFIEAVSAGRKPPVFPSSIS